MELRKSWKKQRKDYQFWLGTLGGTLTLVLFLMIGSGYTRGQVNDQEMQIMEEAIKRAVAQCYAIEGMYPPHIDYIIDNYGVGINLEKYIVHYEVFASNIYPDITIIKKHWGDENE